MLPTVASLRHPVCRRGRVAFPLRDPYFAERLLSRSTHRGSVTYVRLSPKLPSVKRVCTQYTGFKSFRNYDYVGWPLRTVVTLHPEHGTHSFPIWSQGKWSYERIAASNRSFIVFLFEVQPDDGLYRFFTLHRTHLFLVCGENKRCISLGCQFGLCIDTVSFEWEPDLFRREGPSVRCKAKRRYDLHRCLTPLSLFDYSIADNAQKVNSFLLTFSYLARMHKREPKSLGFDSLYIYIRERMA